MKIFIALMMLASWLLSNTMIATAQSDFYQGKTIRIIVGFYPGGGYDALARMLQKFIYVGAVARDESAIALTKASGVSNMERWFAPEAPVKLGTTGPGAFGTDNVIKVIKAALNLQIQIISGYKGTADMRLAERRS